MTEQEKQQWREWKSRAVERWHSEGMDLLAKHSCTLNETDARIVRYISIVMSNPDAHNLYELLGVLRFFDLLERYEWKPRRVKNFFKFYETLKFNGTSGRRRYKLTPVQAFQFANIFGFDNAKGERLTRTAYIFVPRKFSKTTSAASLAVFDMLLGDNNAQAFVGANSYDQAKICFNEIRAIMRDIDPNERHFQVNREKITFKGWGRDSYIRCLTNNAKTQDGLNASLVIMDEYAQARNTAGKNGSDLKNVLTSSMGARREPLTVIISTASEVIDGVFAQELEGVKAVLRGEVENDTVFGSLFMPDVDDEEGDPATWRKVQPHLGVTVREDYYQHAWEDAQLSAENMMVFRTKLLNVFAVNERKSWFTWEQARALLSDFSIDRVTGAPICTVAFDLSVRDDFSAVSYLVYSQQLRKFQCHTDYYFPEGALSGHPNESLYRQWIGDGHLKACKGNCIDVRHIANDIMARTRQTTMKKIGFDSYKARDLVNLLDAAGAENQLQPYSQTYGSFNLPVESFEMMAWSDPPRIEMNDNPINAFCLSNCVIDTDGLENKKPLKLSHYHKIDGTITMLMALGLRLNDRE